MSLQALAKQNSVLAKVVYHKLADPDHKKLRTHVVDGVLQHVNNGYCSLLEPKQISGSQFAEWITGRNPGTYVAVPLHQADRFHVWRAGRWRLARITANGQRGLVGPAGRHHLGLGPAADGLRLPRWPRGRVRHPHQLGDARQLPRLRRAGGAVPLRQRRLERPSAQARRRGDGRRPNAARIQEHAEPSLQRHLRGAVGRALASAATASRSCGSSSRKWPSSSSAARPASGRPASSRCVPWPTTTCPPTATPWRSCRPWRRSWRGRPQGQPGSMVEVNGKRADWRCGPRASRNPPCSTRAESEEVHPNQPPRDEETEDGQTQIGVLGIC